MAAVRRAAKSSPSPGCKAHPAHQFAAEGIVVEVTHRSARRLFGLSGMAPVRNATTAPRRPEPGRGRGRPPLASCVEPAEEKVPALPPVARFDRPAIDYAALDAAMAHCDQVVRDARRHLIRQAPPSADDLGEEMPGAPEGRGKDPAARDGC